MDMSYVNSLLLAIVAFFGVKTYGRIDTMAKTTQDLDKRVAIIETRCEDTHG